MRERDRKICVDFATDTGDKSREYLKWRGGGGEKKKKGKKRIQNFRKEIWLIPSWHGASLDAWNTSSESMILSFLLKRIQTMNKFVKEQEGKELWRFVCKIWEMLTFYEDAVGGGFYWDGGVKLFTLHELHISKMMNLSRSILRNWWLWKMALL